MLTLVHFYTFALLLDATMNMIVTEKEGQKREKLKVFYGSMKERDKSQHKTQYTEN